MEKCQAFRKFENDTKYYTDVIQWLILMGNFENSRFEILNVYGWLTTDSQVLLSVKTGEKGLT